MYLAVRRKDLKNLDLKSLGAYGVTKKKHSAQNKYWCKKFKVSEIFGGNKSKTITLEEGNFVFYKISLAIFLRLFFTKSKMLCNFMPLIRLYQVFPGGKRFEMKNKTYHK